MKTTVSIPGVHCEGCKHLIEDVSKDTPGVLSAHVDLTTKHVAIDHDDRFVFEDWKREIESLNPDYSVLPLS